MNTEVKPGEIKALDEWLTTDEAKSLPKFVQLVEMFNTARSEVGMANQFVAVCEKNLEQARATVQAAIGAQGFLMEQLVLARRKYITEKEAEKHKHVGVVDDGIEPPEAN